AYGERDISQYPISCERLRDVIDSHGESIRRASHQPSPHAFRYAALKSTDGSNGPVRGRLCVRSTIVHPRPLSTGFVWRNTLFNVSIAAQPCHSGATTLAAVTLSARRRSSSGSYPSPPMPCTPALPAPSAGTTPSTLAYV